MPHNRDVSAHPSVSGVTQCCCLVTVQTGTADSECSFRRADTRQKAATRLECNSRLTDSLGKYEA